MGSKLSNANTVSAAYAKNHLAKLLEAVQAGESITVTKYNKKIAAIVPIEETPVRRKPVFGLGKEQKVILDSNWAEAISAEEFLSGKF